LLLMSTPLFLQASVVTEDRFVTLISTRYDQGIISLNFEPIQGENLRYRVYRSTTPIISRADLEKAAFIIEITAEELPVRDEPESDGRYYYAVTVTEEFPNLVPYLNTTTKPIDYAPIPEVIDTFEILRIDKVDDSNYRMAVRFIPAREELAYNLYRSKLPIDILESAELVASVTGADEQFVITVQENVPLYLAITAINRLGVENKTLIPGRNLTSAPFTLETRKPVITEKKKEEEKKEKRPTPKPSMPAAQTIIDRTLRNSFYRGNYKETLRAFESLLQRNDLTRKERGQVAFYTGQSYYYLGEYKKSIRYFVLSKEIDEYREPADVWIERSLNRLR